MKLSAKFDFYNRHGVEEYYIYNPQPDRLELSGFVRQGGALIEIEKMHGHVSPRLGIRFDMTEEGLRIIRPDGARFVTFEELALREEQERQRAREADDRAKQADDRAKQADDRAERLQRELDELRRQAGAPKAGDVKASGR